MAEEVHTLPLPAWVADGLAPPTKTSRPALRREHSLHFIKYMGSKRNLLQFVAPTVREITPRDGLQLDLVAGSHSVGYAVKQHTSIWGNDIQRYTAPIGETLLRTHPGDLRGADLRALIPPAAAHYFREASTLFSEWLTREIEIFDLATEDLDRGFLAYRRFSDDLRACMPHFGDPSRLKGRVREFVEQTAHGDPTDPPIMSAVYWADTYFSLEQALWLDAYRTAIDACLPNEHPARAPALACLLHAATYCSIGSGHFAQYHKVTSKRKLAEQLPYRLRRVGGYWATKVLAVERSLLPSPSQNRVTTEDFRTVLKNLAGVDAIYADPPYSFVPL